MSFLEGYILFSISTSLAVCYIWFWPLVRKATNNNIINSFTQRPWLSLFVFIIMGIIIAPLFILPLLSSTYGQALEHGLYKEISKQEE